MQRALAIIAIISAAICERATADEGPPPPITRATLVGVWEAAPSWAQRVYRLEIAASGDSYLAFTLGSEELVFRLTSASVSHGKVSLRFRSIRDRGADANDLFIAGKGYSSGQFGTFEGTLRMRDVSGDEHLSTVPVSFTMPPWTGELPRLAKKSEDLIKAARRAR